VIRSYVAKFTVRFPVGSRHWLILFSIFAGDISSESSHADGGTVDLKRREGALGKRKEGRSMSAT